MTHNKQLVTLPENLPPALAAEMQEDYENSLSEMMDGIDARPPQIKIAAGGSNNWEIGPDKEAVKEFRGIILANTKANAYWHQQDQIANPILIDLNDDHNYDIPFCTSTDGIFGSRERAEAAADGKAVPCFGTCADCHLNQYETAVNDSGIRGKGKACKNGRRIVVWVEGYDVPYLITLPPTSITAFDAYVTALRGKGKALWAVFTIFKLEMKERGKQRWSVFAPGSFEDVNPADLPEIYKIKNQFKPTIKADITDDDFDKPEVVEVEDGDPNSPI